MAYRDTQQKIQALRRTLLGLINQQDRQMELGVTERTACKAKAVSYLRNRLEFLKGKGLGPHYRLLVTERVQVQALVPGPYTRYKEQRARVLGLLNEADSYFRLKGVKMTGQYV